MPRNIETKASLADLAAARRVAEGLGPREHRVVRQIDRYHAVSESGGERIKVRTEDPGGTAFIRYRRPEGRPVRGSDYEVVPLLEAGLPERASMLGEPVVVVKKRREIFLVGNVRIHLDLVEELGAFIEFEAVVDPANDESECRRKIDTLLAAFGVARTSLVAASYSDLLLAKRAGLRPID